ncbi:MAG: CHRD domain-containing protein [Pyrinomonadaceae bacterium]|nr:CHRD domain-containing protein [Pyrinomonadaceae bacterium]
MKKKLAVASVIVLLGVAAIAFADGGFRRIREFLKGFEEVPAVSTVADGEFRARISHDQTQIQWELSYSDLESAVQQAHIHLGQKDVNGGITVFLCTNLGNGPAGIQLCPPSPATISGTIMAADVSPNIPATLAARNQGLNTGELDELIRAIRAGKTYVNVHTTDRPGGEIRSQINHGGGHDDH